MEPAQKSSVGKTFAGVMLVGLGLAGLVMSLCGGAFAIISLVSKLQGKEGLEEKAWSGLFIVTGSVSLLVGLGVITLAAVVWQRLFKK